MTTDHEPDHPDEAATEPVPASEESDVSSDDDVEELGAEKDLNPGATGAPGG